jgi:hypothetical protein
VREEGQREHVAGVVEGCLYPFIVSTRGVTDKGSGGDAGDDPPDDVLDVNFLPI